MGICCSGKLTKGESFQISYSNKNSKNHKEQFKSEEMLKSVKPFQATSLDSYANLDFEIEKNDLNLKINQLISNFQQANFVYKVQKINFEQLWNIFVEYKTDFTLCNYIIDDLRKTKNQNFIKRFKQINYSLDEMSRLIVSKLEQYKNYLSQKTIIFLTCLENMESVEEILYFFSGNSFNLSGILILDNDLSKESLSTHYQDMIEILDNNQILEYFPLILISLRFFPHLKNEKYIYWQKFKRENLDNPRANKFCSDYLSNPNIQQNDPFTDFIVKNKIILFVKLLKGESAQLVSEFKRKKNAQDIKNGNVCNILEFHLTMINETNISQLDDIINKIKMEVDNNSSVLIQYDEGIDEVTLLQFYFTLLWKLTSVSYEKLVEYISRNQILSLKEMKRILNERPDEIMKILRLFGYKG